MEQSDNIVSLKLDKLNNGVEGDDCRNVREGTTAIGTLLSLIFCMLLNRYNERHQVQKNYDYQIRILILEDE